MFHSNQGSKLGIRASSLTNFKQPRIVRLRLAVLGSRANISMSWFHEPLRSDFTLILCRSTDITLALGTSLAWTTESRAQARPTYNSCDICNLQRTITIAQPTEAISVSFECASPALNVHLITQVLRDSFQYHCSEWFRMKIRTIWEYYKTFISTILQCYASFWPNNENYFDPIFLQKVNDS